MNADQRTVWERNLGTIAKVAPNGAKYSEGFAERVICELTAANPLHFECGQCECKWKFHTQAQLDMIQRHMNAHAMRYSPEATVKAKYPNAVAMNSSAYRAWVILENPSSNHVLSVEYPQSATAGTERAAWADAAACITAKRNTSNTNAAVQAAVGSLSAMDRMEEK